ncbi:MAG: hypothetical protein NTY71_02455 [Methanoregula sp.]|nr:hypothetical protein [Methanoregula sp.]
MQRDEGKTRRGPLPKSVINGFLSATKRLFLEMDPDKRRAVFGEGNARQKKSEIKKSTKKTLADLLVVARNLEDKDLREIFPIDVFGQLTAEIVEILGSDETQKGPFYLNLIKAIQIGMDRNKSRNNSSDRIKISASSKLIYEGGF